MADKHSDKDPLFWNKVFGGILGSLLFFMVINEVGGVVYHPEKLDKPAYVIEVVESGAGAGAVEEVIDLAALLSAADVKKGERVAKKCISCHSFEKGGKTGTGPNLWGIFGDARAARAEFTKYSEALKSFEGVWDSESLFGFLENPKKYLKGTDMSFAGLRKPNDRANMIAYLMSMSDNPVTPEPAAPWPRRSLWPLRPRPRPKPWQICVASGNPSVTGARHALAMICHPNRPLIGCVSPWGL